MTADEQRTDTSVADAVSPSDALPAERLPPPETPRSERVRLLTLDHLDRRTLARRAVQIVEDALITQIGGQEHASIARQLLARRAAVLAVLIEDMEARRLQGESLDVGSYNACLNTLGRLLERIGLDRTAVPVKTLREHLEGRAA